MSTLLPEAQNDNGPPPELHFFLKLLLAISGVSSEFVRKYCPEDISNLLAGAAIAVGAFLYNATVFSTIAVRLFGETGRSNFILVLGGIGLAGFIMTIDSYVFYRCSYILAGLEELARAGLDIQLSPKIRTTMRKFLRIRIGQSCALGLVIGVMVSLLVYAKDIGPHIEHNVLQTNATELQRAGDQADEEIKRATDAMNATTNRVNLLNRQLGAARQAEINARRFGSNLGVANGSQVRALEARRVTEEATLAKQKEELAQLQHGRNQRVRDQVASSPTAAKAQNGILAQINALEEIAGDDWKIAFFIFLIEVCAVGFDLAPVLAKLGYLPTTYAALTARDYLLRRQRIVDETVAPDPRHPPAAARQQAAANDNQPLTGQDRSPAAQRANGSQPARRGPGRPRKDAPPELLGG